MSDLNELPKDRPIHWYSKEIDRAKSLIRRHQEWVDYGKQKLKMMNKIYKDKRREKYGITSTTKTP